MISFCGLSLNCFDEIVITIFAFDNFFITSKVIKLLIISIYGPLLSSKPGVSIRVIYYLVKCVGTCKMFGYRVTEYIDLLILICLASY